MNLVQNANAITNIQTFTLACIGYENYYAEQRNQLKEWWRFIRLKCTWVYLLILTPLDCTGSSPPCTNKRCWPCEEVCCWILTHPNHPLLHGTSVQYLPFWANQPNWCTRKSAFTHKPHSFGAPYIWKYDYTTHMRWVYLRHQYWKVSNFAYYYPVWAICCSKSVYWYKRGVQFIVWVLPWEWNQWKWNSQYRLLAVRRNSRYLQY